MDDKKITPEELKTAWAEDLDHLAKEVAEAMNTAQAGRIIADSEELVREANGAFRERLYQKAMDLLQRKQEAFSPSADGTGAMEEQGAADDEPLDG